MKINRTTILKLLRQQQGSLGLRELLSRAEVDRGNRNRFKDLLDAMVREGAVVRLTGNHYAIPSGSGTVTGTLSSHRDGYGFVSTDDEGGDVFIPARYLRETMHGDQVEVAITAAAEGGKREGRIVRVVSRARSRIVGRFSVVGNGASVIPDEQRLVNEIVIPAKHRGNARHGEMVVAEILSYPTERRLAEGRVVEVLGWPDDPEVEVRTIISKYELPEQFSAAALKAARAVPPSVAEADLEGRVDLRNQVTVTIDGETARDFDDAVAVEQEKNGTIRLWVSIADVSHYVKPDSALDMDAYLRGTSVYFPDRCIPMLPEELSNGICSLNPGVERLALTAEMSFDRSGVMLGSKFYPSVIKSDARLTYTIVRRILVDREEEVRNEQANLLEHLTLMEELALRLMAKRRSRGSIDFDLPEPELVLDLQGGTLAIIRSERNLAHRIIEEFMLAANEAVASHLEKAQVPSLYRIHEPPDIVKLQDFKEFIFNFGYELPLKDESVDPVSLQALLDQAAGKPEERMINEVLLRSMKQARYSAENVGHFGLAAPCYTHFTSPIRRYPDLQVHRMLKTMLKGRLKESEVERLAATLPDIAAHCSTRERTAMEAEREIVDLKKVQFMQGKVGEELDGIITGVTSFGLFVELVELFVEGMVHISTLPQDFYRYVEKQHLLAGERTGRAFRIGDPVRVRVASVSIERKKIDFVVVSAEGDQGAQPVAYEAEEYRREPVKGKRPRGGKPAAGTGKGKGGGRTGGRRRR